jgi:hypothetical protein
MQKWEYLNIYSERGDFVVGNSQGEYFGDEDYKEIDPKGRRAPGEMWRPDIPRTRFLVGLLNKLGSEGWEAVGNVNSGQLLGIYLILKRPASSN